MRKTLISAIAITGLAASAHAADLGDSLKDPLPDGPLTWHGVTLYGTVDVGFGYSNNSPKADAFNGTGINTMQFGNTQGQNKGVFAINPNNLEQSKIGLKFEESIGYGLTAIGQVEMGFVPTTGEINDGCKTVQDRNGVPTYNQLASGDSSRCGQAFGGPAYLGLSSASYGTLTFGRQNTLQLTAFSEYDPNGLSYVASLPGYTGGVSGTGDTEDGRWDNSVKYLYQYGPAHIAGMYTPGGGATSVQSDAYAGDAGITYRGFSIDTVYEKVRGAVSGNAFGFSTSTTPTSSACYAVGTGQVCPPGLSGIISDNSSYSVQAKYVWDLGGGYKDGGYKDSYIPGGKITFYGGAERLIWDNPNSPVTPGAQTVGGYTLYAVNNTNYGTSLIRDLQWAGAKYEWSSWTTSVGYYHYGQNSFLAGAGNATCATNTATNVGKVAAGTAFGNPVASNCAGDFNLVAAVIDYKWTKHFDTYLIANYSTANGGFASGYLGDGSQYTVMTGIRLKF